jgi:hypothetical protein
MVKEKQTEEVQLYQCEECGLHYESRDTAENCEAWCRAYDSCNLEITSSSVERSRS